jgi:hypothetical protein
MFERLGWMVLAKNSGCAYKLVGYKKEVEHFIEVTKNLMHSFADPDKQHDLALLLMHAECLLDFVKKMM